ncbi:MAG TPA: sugar ABC transporter permease [Verrucomicrobiae bacterium]|nr:sugar ABC transporter permease [Verrucomicrobiae bacterium]
MAAIAISDIDRQDRRFGWLLTAPGLTALMLVITFPLFFTVFVSGFDYTLMHRSFDTFVGIENYQSAFGENYFVEALWVTLKFVVCVVLLEFVIGFTIALMLNAVTRFKDVYYLILLMPLLINPVVVALIWRMFLHPELGIVNYLLGLVGIAKVNWLGDPVIAFWTVVLTDIWHQVSFMIVLLLAGLSALPKEPYEAARMDGASTLQSFIHVTLPLMRPVIVVTLLIRLIFAVKTFDLVYVMTRGGPGTATDLISYFIYRSAFFGLNIGQASAISVLLLVIVLALTAYLYRYMRSLA